MNTTTFTLKFWLIKNNVVMQYEAYQQFRQPNNDESRCCRDCCSDFFMYSIAITCLYWYSTVNILKELF